MALSPQWLDELRARTTLSSLIMRTTKLQKAGREWKGCCPFHHEKTPSFTVSDEKGFYHCFGCSAHGDAISWMTDQRGMGFMDAIKELAAEAGMEVPAPDPVAAKRAEKRAELVDVTTAAQDWFMDNLRSADGSEARDYLTKRGFSPATIGEFGFGYAPDSKQALHRALSRFDEAMLIESGMRIATDDGPAGRQNYDRFRARLMLPIQDARGRVIAFGGRILRDHPNAPKYLNSPDTPLFDKGRTLYNLHRASPAARQTGRVVVVEGYMDVVALAEAGIKDAVAPLGTALTEQQIQMLWRMVDVPVLCFDGDSAGQRAAMRAIGRALPMLTPGKSLGFVSLPAGLDPDDFIRERGAGAMEALLSAPRSLVDMLWAEERDAQPLNTPEDKAGLKARLTAHIEAIGDADIKALYRRELLDRFSAFAFPPRPPRSAGQPRGGQGRFSPSGKAYGGHSNTLSRENLQALSEAVGPAAKDKLSSAVFAGLLRFPDQIHHHEDALSRLVSLEPKLAGAVDSLFHHAEMLDRGEKSPISGHIGPDAPPDNTRYTFLGEGLDPQVAREELSEAMSLLVERPALDRALARATARFESDPDAAFAEQQRLLKRKLDFDERLRQMANKRVAD